MEQNPKEHHVVFILDQSGSMAQKRSDTIGGFNVYVSDLRDSADQDGLTTYVSLILFNTDRTVHFAHKEVHEVQDLTESDYRPRSNTALLDAVQATVVEVREANGQGSFGSPNADAPAILVVVFTDGLENASKIATTESVKSLIQECEALGNWTFAYIGEHPENWNQHASIGIGVGSTLQDDTSRVSEKLRLLSRGTRSSRETMLRENKKSVESLFDESKGSTKTS